MDANAFVDNRDRRIELQHAFCSLDCVGKDPRTESGKAVYFQPPKSVKICKPCIIYKRDTANLGYADDKTYMAQWRYQVTVVDTNPDSVIPDKLIWLFPKISPERTYTSDNLYHWVFTLFY